MFEYDKLRKALADMTVRGISPARITAESNVHNIQRIISGKNVVTIKNWVRLHNAFPNDIPEPSYVGGEKVMKNVSASGGSIVANGGVKHAVTGGMHLSPEEQSLINALREFGESENRTIRKILATIDNLAENLRD